MKNIRPYFSPNSMGSHTWCSFEITGLLSLKTEGEGEGEKGPRGGEPCCKTLKGTVPPRFLWDCQLPVESCGWLNPRFSWVLRTKILFLPRDTVFSIIARTILVVHSQQILKRMVRSLISVKAKILMTFNCFLADFEKSNCKHSLGMSEFFLFNFFF